VRVARGPSLMVRRGSLVVLGVALLAGCSGLLPSASPTPEQPREVLVTVVDRADQAPIVAARLSATGVDALTDAAGAAVITAFRGSSITAVGAGFDAGSGTVPDTGDLTIALRSNVVTGTVTSDAGVPIAGVRVFVDGSSSMVSTDAAGAYSLGGVPPQGTLIYKVPGYRLGVIPIDEQMTKNVALPPFVVRGLYAPAGIFEGRGRLDDLLGLIDRTEVNAMVIDVKETDGTLYWATDLAAAKAVGSVMQNPLLQLEELLPQLKARGIYTIARMVVMKDNTLGSVRPDLAVRNSATGQPWQDYRGGIWLDPFNPGVAEYIAALAGDLADKGFDEVQLDYVRFYSDGDYSVSETNLPNTQSFRLPAMRRLFRIVSAALETKRAFFSADVFPISFIATDDQGIGQRPEVIMPYVDYFSPMVYPTHYDDGTFGFAVPNDHPYEVIDATLKIMNRERAGLRMVVRPWIQDFGFGPFPAYTAVQVQAEMQALRDNGALGWMIWNASADFTTDALGGPVQGEDAQPVTTALSAESGSPAATSNP